jgi:hypothetical protein
LDPPDGVGDIVVAIVLVLSRKRNLDRPEQGMIAVGLLKEVGCTGLHRALYAPSQESFAIVASWAGYTPILSFLRSETLRRISRNCFVSASIDARQGGGD